jgi:hypothetical protein
MRGEGSLAEMGSIVVYLRAVGVWIICASRARAMRSRESARCARV